MHPALRKGPLFYKTPPLSTFFTKIPPPISFHAWAWLLCKQKTFLWRKLITAFSHRLQLWTEFYCLQYRSGDKFCRYLCLVKPFEVSLYFRAWTVEFREDQKASFFQMKKNAKISGEYYVHNGIKLREKMHSTNYVVMYLSYRCICIFKLATSSGQRTVSLLYYS